MPRIPHRSQRASGGYYHVLNRGHNREVVFAADDDRAYFLGLLDRDRGRFAVRGLPYCQVGNRVRPPGAHCGRKGTVQSTATPHRGDPSWASTPRL